MNKKWGPNPCGSDQRDLHDVVTGSRTIFARAIRNSIRNSRFPLPPLRTEILTHPLSQDLSRRQRTGTSRAGGRERSTYVARAQAVLQRPPGQIAVKKAAVISVAGTGRIHRAHAYR